ncbi:efflux RND transporter periplasmic adaptor subunit [Aminipila sp.]|uniref:efflux RND transporter periplasmic adaptor subunit n=1 Tax=Aminipila sp. TaxID=2060095 RepID=UPI0028975F14|nr:efflux RND transporter periplasmic adaptor subunit [Aminipila sp.]
MKKFRSYILFLFVMIFLLSGCASFREEAKTVSSEQKDGNQVVQDSNTVEEGELSGKAEAGESVIVMSKSTGKAAEILVDVGSEVKKGQVLLHLDSRDLAASVEVAKANLQNANIAYKYALENEQRARQLNQEGAMSNADYDNGYASVLERAESTVALAQANLDKAQIAYDDSIVTAPMDGTVTKANVKAGELVNPQTQVFTIVNLNQIKIDLFVNEKKINSLKVGQSYKVNLAAIPDQTFSGIIADISQAKDTASKAYPVRITVENPNHVIKDGMFAQVYLSSTDDGKISRPGGDE